MSQVELLGLKVRLPKEVDEGRKDLVSSAIQSFKEASGLERKRRFAAAEEAINKYIRTLAYRRKSVGLPYAYPKKTTVDLIMGRKPLSVLDNDGEELFSSKNK